MPRRSKSVDAKYSVGADRGTPTLAASPAAPLSLRAKSFAQRTHSGGGLGCGARVRENRSLANNAIL